jgi:hypothetical protein
LKPVAWRKKMPSDETSESQPTKQIIVARFTQTACARKGQTVRTDSGTSYRLSKSDKPPCPAERRCEQLNEYTDNAARLSTGVLRFPQLFLRCPTHPSSVIRCWEIRWDSTNLGNIQFKSAGLRGLRSALQVSKRGSRVRSPTLKEFGAVTMGGHGAGVA